MSVQSEIDRINGAKSTLAANIESAGFTAGEGASIVQLASTVGDAFTDTSSRLATVNGTSGTINTQLDTLNGTKTAIRDAIVAKGVEVPEGTTFYEYAGLVGRIESGSSVDVCEVNIVNSGYMNAITVMYSTLDEENKIYSNTVDITPNATSTISCLKNSIISAYGSSMYSFGDTYPYIVEGDISLLGNTSGQQPRYQIAMSLIVKSSGSVNIITTSSGGGGGGM